MRKSELIKEVATRVEVSHAIVREVLDATKDVVLENFTKEPIKVLDILTLTTAERAPRVCRNPRTGESINVAAKIVPKVRCSSIVKDACME